MADQNEEINLLEYWNVLWRRRKMVISICTISVLAAMVMGLLSPKYFRSETVFIPVGPDAGGLAAALSNIPLAGALTGVAGIQSPADKIMVVLRSRTAAEAVIRKFDLLRIFNDTDWDAAKGSWKRPQKPPLLVDAVETLTKYVTKISKSREGFITLTVEWKDPQLAADMANYYVTALTTMLNEKSINITIQVVDKAVPAEKKSRPKIRVNMMLAGLAGLFVSMFLAFFLEYLDKQKRPMA